MAETLPEGTDHIVPGAASTNPSGGGASSGAASDNDAADLKGKAQAKASEWSAQAVDHARDYAEQGKEKASAALGSVARLIDDNAAQIDDRLGAHYGDYARRASAFVNDAADGLREKDIEELLDNAREFVRRSPRIAMAAAAASGFLTARVVKAGTAHMDVTPPTTGKGSAQRAKSPTR
ncbi:hypothetical protein [Sphingomonas sp.]|uniref:hypothetical protein n=1 Tax=Sphingomonas sp. TaxID=28214 RepID=UPI003AFFBA08